MRPLSALLTVAFLAIGSLQAQTPVLTGNASFDFPSAVPFVDTAGDVTMPPSLASGACGFDVREVRFHFDVQSDTLWVAITTGGITGDADGDGDPSTTSAALAALGGIDRPDFGGSETFALTLDFDLDGTPEIIAGLPAGHDLSGSNAGFVVAAFAGGGSLTAPASAFGTVLTSNTGVVGASPDASAPDLEFSISNFSSLMATFAPVGQAAIGFNVHLGSDDDAGIGDDGAPTSGAITVTGTEIFPCFPVANLLSPGDLPLPNGPDWIFVTRYGVLDQYGCCMLISLSTQPGFTLTNLGGTPTVEVGLPGDLLGSIIVVDLGVPFTGGAAITCKDQIWDIPGIIPSLTHIYFQIFSYPVQTVYDPSATFYCSNVLCWEQP